MAGLREAVEHYAPAYRNLIDSPQALASKIRETEAFAEVAGPSQEIHRQNLAAFRQVAAAAGQAIPVPSTTVGKSAFLENPGLLAAGSVGALIAGGGLVAAGSAIARRRRTSRRKSRSRPSTTRRRRTTTARRRRSFSGRSRERFAGITGTARQYRRRGGGRVRYTKRGQPYVLDRTGKARFIKRSRSR